MLIAAIAFLAFLGGIAAVVFRLPGAEPAYQALDNARLLLSDSSEAAVDEMHQLYPARYDGSANR